MKKIKIINAWNFITGGVCAFLGLLIYFVVIPQTIHVKESNLIQTNYFTNAAFVPKIWAFFIILFSLLILYENVAKGAKAETWKTVPVDKPSFLDTAKYTLLLMAIMSLYVFLLPVIGFPIASALLLASCLWAYGYRNILAIVIISVITPILIFFIWEKLLYVTFP